MWEDFVDPLFEMFHDQMVLLFPVLVFCLGFEPAQLAGVGRSKAIQVLG